LGFYILHAIIGFDFITNNTPIDKAWIAIIHTMFNLLATSLLLPFGKQLAKLATLTVRDTKKEEEKPLFDDRLLATPAIAIEHARQVTVTMAERTLASVKKSFDILNVYTKEKFREIEREEGEIDVFEDEIGSYLLKITSHDLSETDSFEVTKLLHTIGDLERLSDHSVNIAESADEMFNKDISFSEEAKQELKVMIDAVGEILDKAINSFKQNDSDTAACVEPLEEVIDSLRSEIKLRHIQRLKNNECTVELGFILTDLLTNLERVADHCSNIAGCVIEISRNSLGLHSYTESVKRGNTQFERDYAAYAEKYQLG
jgi:phosphate:Na+ symporter